MMSRVGIFGRKGCRQHCDYKQLGQSGELREYRDASGNRSLSLSGLVQSMTTGKGSGVYQVSGDSLTTELSDFRML